ncbi:MAG: hypothetical protein AB7K86_05175 [Rhodospirillales bacterium]
MPQVFIMCPRTGRYAYTGQNLSWNEIDSLDLGQQSFECKECGDCHTWTKNDAHLRADGGGD